MKKKYLKILLFIGISLLVTTSCKEIRDLLKAIDKYGYKSSIPLGKKEIPLDKLLTGSYVYNDLPLIISEKDNLTYQIKFLSTELDGTDIVVDAFLSKIGNSKYLNIDLGYNYTFLKISEVSITRDVNVKLLRNSIDQAVTEKNLVSWLLKNGEKDDFLNKDSIPVDIFYSFSFTRITNERAYQIKAEQLQAKKEVLFNTCKDYETYKTLSEKYPGDQLLANARESIFRKCNTIDDYNEFVSYFADDALSLKAKKLITEMTLYIKDSVDFNSSKGKDDIDAYLNFIEGCSTTKFKDSAASRLTPLITNITEDNIEWKWNGGAKNEAIKLIFHKIDYAGRYININWYNEHLTIYCLKLQQPEIKEKALLYLDKLASCNTTKNELLDLYISKGFILWSLERYDQCIEVFRSRIKEVYLNKDDLTFKKSIKENYKKFQNEGIKFPDDKNMWKKIKKLN